ncbi:MAG: hypothetical protein Q3M24_12125 [Candidatus Electrothrix aestuarii]|uniref:Transposase/invertase (TIGR01784 family) n=1 Tax=Candidatus Electrothrix aestuarii TaxID=3062594 RepID=A0AAU8LPE3_9BACT|nr:hypothetical protein [Candidatus Electrothrix aestuarii]
MPTKERYINLFTDYGFKKIFGEEPNKIFDTAKIARFTPDQIRSYEKIIKHYRSMKNFFDTAFDEGKEEGEQKKEREIVINGLRQGLDKEVIASLTGLSLEAIEKIAPDIHEEES